MAFYEMDLDRRGFSVRAAKHENTMVGVVASYGDVPISVTRHVGWTFDVQNTCRSTLYGRFRICALTACQIPLEALMLALGRALMGAREPAVARDRVKPADILFNSSVILGKQIVHILPEGYVAVATSNLAQLTAN